jgi:protease I
MKTNASSPTKKKIAILAADGFEQVELDRPRAALDRAGFETRIVSPNPKTVKGMQHAQPGRSRKVDVTLKKARASDYDASGAAP